MPHSDPPNRCLVSDKQRIKTSKISKPLTAPMIPRPVNMVHSSRFGSPTTLSTLELEKQPENAERTWSSPKNSLCLWKTFRKSAYFAGDDLAAWFQWVKLR